MLVLFIRGQKANRFALAFQSDWQVQDPANDLEDPDDFLIMASQLSFDMIESAQNFFVRRQQFSDFNEGTNNLNVDGNSPFAVEDA